MGLALGGVFFVVYYFLFTFAIKFFDLKTPGREEDDTLVPVDISDEDTLNLAQSCIRELGGPANLVNIDSCIIRLGLEVKDPSAVNEDGLKRCGAKGVVRVGEKGVQVILGTQAELVAMAMGGMQREESELAAEGSIALYAPIEGEIVPIEDVPDPVFADKVVGDGVAIIPSGDTMCAPADGVIGKIFKANHAFSMETEDGVELFVHFGIDTVALKGEGFTRVAEEGASVKKGDPVIRYDLALLREKVSSVVTPVVVSNVDDYAAITKMTGKVVIGSPILTLKKK